MKDIPRSANRFPYACQRIPDKEWDSLDFDGQMAYCYFCKRLV